jgi:prepilin-type processing-associated H-X9-DG protein
LSNVKQLELAVNMYASDYGQRYPNGNSVTAGGSTGTPDWANAIYPYVKNVGIYVCPSDTPGGTIGVGGTVAGYSDGVNGKSSLLNSGSYGMNVNLCNNADALIQVPAEMLGLVDASGVTVATGMSDAATQRHNGGCNMSFVDGHANWAASTGLPVAGATTPSNGNHYWLGKD